MKYQTIIISYAGGIPNEIARGDIIELSDEEFEITKNTICKLVGNTSYFDMNNIIVPGEFFRNNCVLQIIEIK